MPDNKKNKKSESIQKAVEKIHNIGNLNESVNKIPDFKYTATPPPPKKEKE